MTLNKQSNLTEGNLSTVPSPFKRNLFWPEPSTSTKKRRTKEQIPAVVASEQYKAYLKKKEDKKKKMEEVKEIRRLQREARKIVEQEEG